MGNLAQAVGVDERIALVDENERVTGGAGGAAGAQRQEIVETAALDGRHREPRVPRRTGHRGGLSADAGVPGRDGQRWRNQHQRGDDGRGAGAAPLQASPLLTDSP